MPGLWGRFRSRQQGAKVPELADAQRLIFELEEELSTPCAHLWLAVERLRAGDRTRARAHMLTSGLSYFEGTGMLSNFDERAFFGFETGEQAEAYVLDGVSAAHRDIRRKLEPQAEAFGPLGQRVVERGHGDADVVQFLDGLVGHGVGPRRTGAKDVRQRGAGRRG